MAKRKTKAEREGFDREQFEKIQTRAKKLKEDYSARDTLLEAMEQLLLLNWESGKPQAKHDSTKLTLSPDPANKLLGAQRLMIATEPVITIPYEENDTGAKQVSEKLEKFGRVMWKSSGSISGAPIHYDAVLSALTYASVHIGLTSTKDLVEAATDDIYKERAQEIEKQTPILFECWNSREGYPERDRFGLTGYLRRYSSTVRELKQEWPEAAAKVLGNRKDEIVVNACDWYDLKWRCVWVEEQKAEPLFMGEHKLGFVPVVAQITEGSRLFNKPEEQIRPFLYTLHKSGLWKRQNLAFTVLFTNIFALASSALFKHVAPPGDPGKRLTIDMSRPFNVAEMDPGETFELMASKGAIDPALITALELAERKGTESTIYSQALGEPLGANAPFSMVALLHQAGRLPLVSTQKLTGWAIARAMEMAFKWIKKEGKGAKAMNMGNRAEIKVSDIPDIIHCDVKLDIDLPMDLRTMGVVAGGLVKEKMASRRWARENLLKIGQSDEMDEEIWGEDMAYYMAMALMQQLEAQKMQREQAEAQAAAAAARPVAPPEEEAPVEGGEVTPTGAAEGLPMTEPVAGMEREGETWPPREGEVPIG